MHRVLPPGKAQVCMTSALLEWRDLSNIVYALDFQNPVKGCGTLQPKSLHLRERMRHPQEGAKSIRTIRTAFRPIPAIIPSMLSCRKEEVNSGDLGDGYCIDNVL